MQCHKLALSQIHCSRKYALAFSPRTSMLRLTDHGCFYWRNISFLSCNSSWGETWWCWWVSVARITPNISCVSQRVVQVWELTDSVWTEWRACYLCPSVHLHLSGYCYHDSCSCAWSTPMLVNGIWYFEMANSHANSRFQRARSSYSVAHVLAVNSRIFWAQSSLLCA